MGAIVDALEREWEAGGERVIRWPDAHRCLQQTVLSGEQWAGPNVRNARRSVREQLCRHLAADASGSTLRISGSSGGASARHYVWDLATEGRAAATIWKAQDDARESTAAADVIAAFKRPGLSTSAVLHRSALELRRGFAEATKPERGFSTSAAITYPALIGQMGGTAARDWLYTVATGQAPDADANEAVLNRCTLHCADLYRLVTGHPTPKHDALGSFCRANNVPKSVTDLLDGMGHSCSHRRAREGENGFAADEALSVIAMLKELKKKYPDLEVSLTWDNCDHATPGSLDGKQYSHLNGEIWCYRSGGGPIELPPLTKAKVSRSGTVASNRPTHIDRGFRSNHYKSRCHRARVCSVGVFSWLGRGSKVAHQPALQRRAMVGPLVCAGQDPASRTPSSERQTCGDAEFAKNTPQASDRCGGVRRGSGKKACGRIRSRRRGVDQHLRKTRKDRVLSPFEQAECLRRSTSSPIVPIGVSGTHAPSPRKPVAVDGRPSPLPSSFSPQVPVAVRRVPLPPPRSHARKDRSRGTRFSDARKRGRLAQGWHPGAAVRSRDAGVNKRRCDLPTACC